jgi:hypothetical protein
MLELAPLLFYQNDRQTDCQSPVGKSYVNNVNVRNNIQNIFKHRIIEIRIKSDQLIKKMFILTVGCGAVNFHVSYINYVPKFLMGSFGRPFKGRVTGRYTRTLHTVQ